MAAAMAAMLLPLLVQGWSFPSAANIDIHVQHFGNGAGEEVLAFAGAGIDITLSLSLQMGLRVVSACLNITGLPATPGGTDCPESPSLDLGADGSTEWRFNGTGYGSLGHQYLFADGNTSFCADFGAGGGSNGSMAIRLPARSTVTGATLKLTPSGFTDPLNVSVDIGDDSVPDWGDTALAGEATLTGLESVFTSLVASAVPVNDTYGVGLVDVPVRVSCNSTATMTFSELSMGYSCTLTTCDMAAALDALIPDTVGTDNVTVPIKVSSYSAGKLKLSDVSVHTQPPLHSPLLLDPSPPPDPSMDENTSLGFSVRAQDIYGNPLALQWYLDAAPVPGANGTAFTYNADFSSSGRHMVMVTATSDLSEANVTWWVTVRDVNRPPMVLSRSPQDPVSGAENIPIRFNVTAIDPDGGQLSYAWLLDGRDQGVGTAEFIYRPTYGNAGVHDVRSLIRDGMGLETAVAWCVTVRKSNAAPVITEFSPQPGTVTMLEGTTASFSVEATDANSDPLAFDWMLDGLKVASGKSYDYSADFSSAGYKTVGAIVSDGEFTVGHSWSLKVMDVNRPPVAAIDGIAEGTIVLENRTISLAARCSDPDGDNLTLAWYDGEQALGNGPMLNVSFLRGPHLVRLVAIDGRGGTTGASVNITVRWARVNLTAKVSPAHPIIGEDVKLTVRVVGEGDAATENLTLRFNVDGEELDVHFIARVSPGDNQTETFVWTAESGSHELTVSAGSYSFRHVVTPGEEVQSMFYPMILIVVVLVASLMAAALYFFHLSRGSGAGRSSSPARPDRSAAGREASVLDKVYLDSPPYQGQTLEIQTTVPEANTQEMVKKQLTAKLEHYLVQTQPPAGAPAPPAPTEEARPGTEAAFSSSAAPVGAMAQLEEVPVPPAAAEEARQAEEPAEAKRPRRRMNEIEDRIIALEKKGTDATATRRLLSLARSFWKGGNLSKAEQYFAKAEARLTEQESVAESKGIPLCPNCGATVDPTWATCSECKTKL